MALRLLMLLPAFVAPTVPAVGQPAAAELDFGSLSRQVNGNIKLVIDDGRPLGQVAYELMSSFPVVVTYEDPILSYEGDLESHVNTRTGRERTTPRNRSLRFTGPFDAAAPDWAVLLAAVTSQYNAAAGNGRFAIEVSGDVYHIVPTAVRDSSGEWVPYKGVLDARITIPAQELDGQRMMEVVLATIAAANGLDRIRSASGFDAFARSRGILEANDEVARDALLRTLAMAATASHRNRRFGWILNYGPDVGYYAFNLTGVTVPERFDTSP